ncbi:MAG: hypothetical protein LBI33_14550 [Propionibacteriaceae bacterium]|jgi:hypothetical protein|nr:hypothetical protein [Propionibacteriaceae bacterium]
MSEPVFAASESDLLSLAKGLDGVQVALQSSVRTAEWAGIAAGHAGVETALTEAAGKWEIARWDLITAVLAMKAWVLTVIEETSNVDAALGAAAGAESGR